jgi:hypothetical protein
LNSLWSHFVALLKSDFDVQQTGFSFLKLSLKAVAKTKKIFPARSLKFKIFFLDYSHALALKSPFSFALVLLSIEWARCLGEMKTARRASSWRNHALLLLQSSCWVYFQNISMQVVNNKVSLMA